MNRYIIGIDPGLSGGISVLDMEGNVIEAVRMPETMQDLLDFLRGNPLEQCVAYMESVGFGMPGQSSSATAKFARHCGHLEMALQALGVRTNTVTPQKWMKAYQLGRSGDYGKREWKNRLKAKAQQLFPVLGKKVTLATCDSLLIAMYGLGQERGK